MATATTPRHESLVRFVRAMEEKARELAAMEAGQEEMDDFYARCAHFDALPEDVKVAAIEEAHKQEEEPEAPPVRRPMRVNHIGPSFPVVLPEEGRYTAHRAGKVDLIGYGETQLEAIDDLERQEQEARKEAE